MLDLSTEMSSVLVTIALLHKCIIHLVHQIIH